jgi:cytochrome c oxidase subunit 3
LAESHAIHHNPALKHQFDTMEQQKEAGTIGMWVFLLTEIMFFGGLFLAYIIYRAKYPDGFAIASNTLDVRLGGLNTVVLIVSSLTMAMAVHSAQIGKQKKLIIYLVLTLILGCVFLGVKAVEYEHKIATGLFPAEWTYNWNEHHSAKAEYATQAHIFIWIYFAMTGLHALHMVIGAGMLLFLIYFAWRGKYSPAYYAPVELGGLYWHFVDIVWIFLFPLLYLLGYHLGTGH